MIGQPGLLVFLMVLSKLKKPNKTMSPVHHDLSITVNYVHFVKGESEGKCTKTQRNKRKKSSKAAQVAHTRSGT